MAEAIAGTENGDVYMTPLRTKQAIDQFGAANWEHLATKEANNDANIDFDEFDSSRYVDYQFVFRSILPANDNARFRLRPSDDGGTSQTSIKEVTTWTSADPLRIAGSASNGIGTATDEPGVCGSLIICDFHGDSGAMMTSAMAYVRNDGRMSGINDFVALQRPSVDDPLNHIRFDMSSGNIASGQISLYGLPDRFVTPHERIAHGTDRKP